MTIAAYIAFHKRTRAAMAIIRSEGLQAVANAMWRLNRYAGGPTTWRPEIYRMKTALISWMYPEYCEGVGVHKQDHACHSCGGTGQFLPGVTCLKCNGTGIFKTTILYNFVIVVDGIHYSWHIPKDRCWWPVDELRGTPPRWDDEAWQEFADDNIAGSLPYKKAREDSEMQTEEECKDALLLVDEFLMQNGVDADVIYRPTLRTTAEMLLSQSSYRAFHTCGWCHKLEYIMGIHVGNHDDCLPF